MSDTDELTTYAEILPKIGELAEELLAHPDPAVRQQIEELLDWVDVFHREGLGRLTEMIRLWRGEVFLSDASEDEVVGEFLRAYDLAEGDDREMAAAYEAVEAALEEVRPFVESHGGTIIVDSVADGIVKVQMLGSCDGCPSSSATLTGGVEQALRDHWPNFRRLEVVDPAAETNGDAGGHSHDASPEPQGALLQIRGHEGA